MSFALRRNPCCDNNLVKPSLIKNYEEKNRVYKNNNKIK